MEFISIFLLCCIATFRATLGAPTDTTAVPFMYNMSILAYIEANNLSNKMAGYQHNWTEESRSANCDLNLAEQMADLYLAKDWSGFEEIDQSMCPNSAILHTDDRFDDWFPRKFNDEISKIPKRFRDQFTDEERNQIISSVTTGCDIEGSKNRKDWLCVLGKLAPAIAFFEERALSPYLPFRAWARILLQIYHDCNSAGSIADNLIIARISAGYQLPGCFIQAIEKVVSTLEWSFKDLKTAVPEFEWLYPAEIIQQIPSTPNMMPQSQEPSVALV